ncbi:MAG: protein kinase, partial [Planctomycetes bacterium]|nr:protein kinase [Planctomycetota bacterium]
RAPAAPLMEAPSTQVPFAPDLETLTNPKALVEGNWYIAIGQAPRGPMPLESVKEHIVRRELTPDCLVWREGMKDWELAKNVRPIAILFGAVAAQSSSDARGAGASSAADERHATVRISPEEAEEVDAPVEEEDDVLSARTEQNADDDGGETIVIKKEKIAVPASEYPAIDGYRIEQVIGKGGMGVVYRAVQVAMDRSVAVKVLAGKYAQSQTFVQRFLKEARASARLSHPNIIQGIDVREAKGKYCFIMEYVDGPRVGDLLRRGGAMDPARALNIVIQVARALEHAHKHGMVHRDVKPDNIMLTKDGQAKLCDLGMVLLAEEEGGQIGGGTPNYLSPEQARGDGTVDHRADIYCLGTTFYHMLVGAVPFSGATRVDIMRKQVSEPPVPPSKRNPTVTPGMSAVVMRMIEKHPDNRYQAIPELIKDLTLLSMGSSPMVLGGPAADAAAAAASKPRVSSRPTRLPPRISRRRRLR